MTDLYGCGDHGCIYGHRGGMGTNGGCGCWRALTRAAGADGRKAVRQILALRAERDQLQVQLAEALELLAEVDVPADMPESRVFPYGAQSWVRRRNVLRGEE